MALARELVGRREKFGQQILDVYVQIEAQKSNLGVADIKSTAQQIIDEMTQAIKFSVSGIQGTKKARDNAYSVFLSTGWFGDNFRGKGTPLEETEFGVGLKKRAETAEKVKDFLGVLEYVIEVLSRASHDNLPEGLSSEKLSEANKFATTWWKPRVEDLVKSLERSLQNIVTTGRQH